MMITVIIALITSNDNIQDFLQAERIPSRVGYGGDLYFLKHLLPSLYLQFEVALVNEQK